MTKLPQPPASQSRFSGGAGSIRALLLVVFAAVTQAAWPGSAPEGLPAVQEVGRHQGFTGSYPEAIVTDPDGRYWVSTANGELFVGDGFRFLPVDLPPALQGKVLQQMACDAQGRICLLSSGGLGLWERGTWRVDEGIKLSTSNPRRRSDGFAMSPAGALVLAASGKAYRLTEAGVIEPLALP